MIQNQNKYSQAFAKAMDIIADKKIDQAEISSTIQGFIAQCKDASIGEYSVQYQDSRIIAYGDPNTNYKKGTKVYVYVPNGDFSQYKVILGATNRIGTDYISESTGQEYYNVGENLVEKTNSVIKLCSYKPGQYIIYPKESETNTGEGIQLSENIESIIKNSNYLKIGATIQTNLPYEQKHGNGRYGIKITAIIKNSATGKPEEQYFYFDSNNLDGNPEEYTTALYQQVAHWIDSTNFVSIKKIVYYIQNFPHTFTQSNGEEPAADIFLIDFSINGSYRLTEEERTNVGIILKAPQGYTFGTNSSDESTRHIEASLRVKMKQVDLENQGAKVYWFIQDLTITSKSLGFLRQGGLGWRCLNPYLLMEEETNSYEYNPQIAIDIPYTQVKYAKETNFKCVIVYDGKSYSKEFVITNTNVTYTVTLESSTGETDFSYSVGSPNLICKVFANNIQQDPDSYIFRWQVTNNQNITEYLYQNNNFEEEYNRIKGKREEIQNKIGTPPTSGQEHYWKSLVNRESEDYYNDFTFPQEEQVQLKSYEWFYNEYKRLQETYEGQQRVSGNILYNIDLHQIIYKSTFRCSCYYLEKVVNEYGEERIVQRFIGTAVIDIKNSQTPQEGYTLLINHGDQVFLYNEEGTSLHSAAIDEPYNIYDLTYTLWHNGNAIDQKDLNGVVGIWQIPLNNTMLEMGQQQFIEGNTLKIDVKNNYDPSLTNNTIHLILHYKQQVFQSYTNFVFTKEGQNGTNGTKYHFKLKIKDNPDGIIRLKKTYTQDENPKFEIEPQLWYNGVKQNNTGIITYKTLTDNNNPNSVHSFTGGDTVSHNIILTEETVGERTVQIPLDNPNLMNIIEAQYKSKDGFNYYADLPIPIIQESNPDYIVTLKPNSGFRYVTYKSDGTKPSYNKQMPFEVYIEKIIRNTYDNEVVETQNVTNYESEGFTYEWKIFPPKPTEEDQEDNSLLTIVGSNTTPTCNVIPKSIFEKGNQVNNAVYLKITKGEEVFAEVHIPIHFMLNKYQNKMLNDWNGTSIEINETDGYILMPQVGAGKKEKDKNTFTGVVLGTAAAGGNLNQTGLFAYGDGVRSIFLDAYTGNATFGKNTQDGGQIIIDVASNEGAVIQSGDYKNDYYNNYNITSDQIEKGMKIKFSGNPYIRFASGNFHVESDGTMYAKAGEIAGWTIDKNCLYKIQENEEQSTNQYVGISPGMKLQVTSDVPIRKAEGDYYYIDNVSFWAGGSDLSNPQDIKSLVNFFVTQNGYLFSRTGQIAGWDFTKNMMYKRESSYWIGMSPCYALQVPSTWARAEATTVKDEEGNEVLDGNGKPIKTAFIPNVCFWAGPYDVIAKLGNRAKPNFYVTTDGYVHSEAGNIAGWEISESGFIFKETKKVNNADVKVTVMGIGHGQGSGGRAIYVKDAKREKDIFLVTNTGKLYSGYGQIGNLHIGQAGLFSEVAGKDSAGKTREDTITFGNVVQKDKSVYIGADGIRLGTKFYINDNGVFQALQGNLGNCEVSDAGILKNGSEGSWSLKSNGTASFTYADISGQSKITLNGLKAGGGSEIQTVIGEGAIFATSKGVTLSPDKITVTYKEETLSFQKFIQKIITEITQNKSNN